MLACSFQAAGLRVFDIRDPNHAKEIAYWKPGAVRTEVRPSSGSWGPPTVFPGIDRTVDKTAHWARWFRRKGNDNSQGNNGNDGDNSQGNNGNGSELELWTVSDGNGFQILRFTDNFKAHNSDLFEGSSE
jgi:hypothetical protein